MLELGLPQLIGLAYTVTHKARRVTFGDGIVPQYVSVGYLWEHNGQWVIAAVFIRMLPFVQNIRKCCVLLKVTM